MSVSITIRHVPEETRDALAGRAARSGRSLQEFLSRELRRIAEEPSPEDWVGLAEQFAGSNTPERAKRILEDLEADRR